MIWGSDHRRLSGTGCQARKDRGLTAGPTTEEIAEIHRLRREVADQQRTIEILKAATTFSSGMQIPGGGDDGLHRRPPRPLERRSDVQGARVSQRTYYAAKARPASSRSVADKEHKAQIRRVWENNYRVYGPRRVWKRCTAKVTGSPAAASSG